VPDAGSAIVVKGDSSALAAIPDTVPGMTVAARASRKHIPGESEQTHAAADPGLPGGDRRWHHRRLLLHHHAAEDARARVMKAIAPAPATWRGPDRQVHALALVGVCSHLDRRHARADHRQRGAYSITGQRMARSAASC